MADETPEDKVKQDTDTQASEMIQRMTDLRDEVDSLHQCIPITEDTIFERFQLQQCVQTLNFGILLLKSFKEKERY